MDIIIVRKSHCLEKKESSLLKLCFTNLLLLARHNSKILRKAHSRKSNVVSGLKSVHAPKELTEST